MNFIKSFTITSVVATSMFAQHANAQEKVSLSGYIKDEKSGETLLGATVFIKELGVGTSSNAYGFYSLSVPKGNYLVRISYLGYKDIEETISFDDKVTRDFEMSDGKDGRNKLQEVVITAKKADDNVTNTQMGVISLSPEKLKKLPVIFGEADILKAIQLLPGVQSSGEGTSGFYVRGGGPDQNLVLLDEAVVYNTGHLFGFFSIFNSDAIKSVDLMKGGAPANFGGRLSSVLNVSMKDGNNKEFHGEGGIGIIASRLTLEGPIKKEKGSFIVSGRRTYIDALTKPFIKGNLAGTGYYFYDMNLKANYRISPKDRIFLSGYYGKDVFTFKNKESDFNLKIPWGNATTTLRWNHQFNDKLFMNVSGIYNKYDFKFTGGSTEQSLSLSSGIKDWNGKLDFDYFTKNNQKIKFGVNYTYHTISPSQISGKSDDVALTPDNPFTKYAHESAIYITDEFEVTKKLSVNVGLRYSHFDQIGPYSSYTYADNGSKIDSNVYSAGEYVKGYGGLEPRFNARLTLDDQSSLKVSVSKAYQYLHLVSNNGSTLPTDVWLPSTGILTPQRAWQYSLGYFRNLMDNNIETSVEVYYKDLQNQYEFRSGYTPSTIRDQEYDLVIGKGKAYGAEFFVNKTKGRFTGWIGYTLSWTMRAFPDLNNGEQFPAKFDRRHDISIVGNYEFNKKLNASAIFVFGTGNAITLPTSYYILDGQLVQDYSKINQFRVFPYHRLDLSLNYTPGAEKENKKFKSTWSFSIYNAYSRMNPYILYVSSEGTLAQGAEVKVKQISIFPILPSVTWNFKF